MSRLGVDFGTSHTVAVLQLAGKPGEVRTRQLVFDGSPLLPSGVTVYDGGSTTGIATGADARHLAEVRPDAYEPAPKARVDEGRVLLGGREVEVCDLVAAVLRRVREEAERTGPLPAGSAVLTVPAAWAAHRRGLLVEAAARAGLPGARLLPEPVAAARAFVHRLPDLARDGATALVYDLGAGTFDATVLRRRGTDLEVLHTTGLADAGGADVDEAVVTFVGTVWGDRHPDLWARLADPRTGADRRDRRRLWESARTAKEMLSRLPVSIVALPGTGAEFTLDRATFDRLAAPLVGRTVRAARAAVTAAGLSAGDVDAVLLVGGASRMPLVSDLLTAEFGRPPVAVDQPELVVAQGSLAGNPSTVDAPPTRTASAMEAQPTLSPSTMDPRAARRRRVARTAGAAAALLLLAATVGLAVRTGGERRPVDTTWVAASTVPTSSASTEMSPSLRQFAAAWARDLPCHPTGFEGPFDVPSGIRAELVERFRCDITTGPGQGATVYFGYFGASAALGALRRYHGATSGSYATFARYGIRVIMWYDSDLTMSPRRVGWLQMPSAAVSDYQLSKIWDNYERETRAMASASASASPR
jgi:hypothetical protein